jgi:hypothetical protein
MKQTYKPRPTVFATFAATETSREVSNFSGDTTPRKCRKCGFTRPTAAFRKDPGGLGGYSRDCKEQRAGDETSPTAVEHHEPWTLLHGSLRTATSGDTRCAVSALTRPSCCAGSGGERDSVAAQDTSGQKGRLSCC